MIDSGMKQEKKCFGVYDASQHGCPQCEEELKCAEETAKRITGIVDTHRYARSVEAN